MRMLAINLNDSNALYSAGAEKMLNELIAEGEQVKPEPVTPEKGGK